jgi:hypothetical protein
MKLNRKSILSFIALSLFAIACGTLAWEILERIIRLIPDFSQFSLTMKEPIRLFDIYVLSLSFRANLGTLLGMAGGVILFFLI